jgi:hypothetical protein
MKNDFICVINTSGNIELDALGDELEFEEEDVPSYLQEDSIDLPKAAETDPKLVRLCF